jgi:hypothetical protein
MDTFHLVDHATTAWTASGPITDAVLATGFRLSVGETQLGAWAVGLRFYRPDTAPGHAPTHLDVWVGTALARSVVPHDDGTVGWQDTYFAQAVPLTGWSQGYYAGAFYDADSVAPVAQGVTAQRGAPPTPLVFGHVGDDPRSRNYHFGSGEAWPDTSDYVSLWGLDVICVLPPRQRVRIMWR